MKYFLLLLLIGCAASKKHEHKLEYYPHGQCDMGEVPGIPGARMACAVNHGGYYKCKCGYTEEVIQDEKITWSKDGTFTIKDSLGREGFPIDNVHRNGPVIIKDHVHEYKSIPIKHCNWDGCLVASSYISPCVCGKTPW